MAVPSDVGGEVVVVVVGMGLSFGVSGVGGRAFGLEGGAVFGSWGDCDPGWALVPKLPVLLSLLLNTSASACSQVGTRILVI